MTPSLTKFLEYSIFEWVALFAAILFGIWAVFRIRTWFREVEDPAAQAHEMLIQFRDSFREGNISEAEYRSIKSRLIKREFDSPLDPGSNAEATNDAENRQQ